MMYLRGQIPLIRSSFDVRISVAPRVFSFHYATYIHIDKKTLHVSHNRIVLLDLFQGEAYP